MRLLCLFTLVVFVIVDAQHCSGGGDKFRLEPGYTLLFNGKDLTGWKMKQGGASLDGKTETKNKRFQILEGNIVIDGKARGNMVIDTAKEFGKDVHIKFEFMAGKGCNNDLYFRGLKFDIKMGGVKNLKMGQWQLFEIIATGKKVEFKADGETQRAQKAKTASSPLGVRAEFGAIQIRRMRYKEAS